MAGVPILPISDLHQDFLHDESRLTGYAEWICFPQNIQQAIQAFEWAKQQQIAVTMQGSRTGIVAGAVPQGGLIVNLTKMAQIGPITGDAKQGYQVVAEPGVLCQQLNDRLSKERLFFAPDPTETTATIGGMFSHNARGLCSYRYGAMADHVLGITLLRADGTLMELKRGQCRFDSTGCTLPDGTRLELGQLPQHSAIPCVPVCGMDLIDLIAGSEGSLGAVVQLTLQVLPCCEEPWGVIFFFETEEKALSFCETVRAKAPMGICCMEFFDRFSLKRVEKMKETSTSLKALIEFPKNSKAAIYLEISHTDSAIVYDTLMELLTDFSEQGGAEEESRAVSGQSAVKIFHQMRHAVPESVNMSIDILRQTLPQAHKFGLDFYCPELSCPEQYKIYSHIIDEFRLPYVIFGHAVERHLHCNLIPANAQQLALCPQAVARLAQAFSAKGANLCFENGVGKLKAEYLPVREEEKHIITQVRGFFDPEKRMNPNDLWG